MEELELFTYFLKELPFLLPLYHCWPCLCHSQFYTPMYPGCSTSSPVSAGFQRKNPACTFKAGKKYPLKRVRQAISADRLCLWAHTQVLLLIQQPS